MHIDRYSTVRLLQVPRVSSYNRDVSQSANISSTFHSTWKLFAIVLFILSSFLLVLWWPNLSFLDFARTSHRILLHAELILYNYQPSR